MNLHFIILEQFHHDLKNEVLYEPQCRVSNNAGTHTIYLAFNSYSHNPVIDNNLPEDEFLSLRELSKLDDVIVAKPDKGNGIVSLNKQNLKDGYK